MSEKLRHKTAAIIGTVTSVPNYPKLLRIYLNNASPYWQAVYWDKGKTYRKTMKTEDKLLAYEKAKVFYELLILKKYQHSAHLQQHVISEANKPINVIPPDNSFKEIATQWIARQATRWSARHAKIVEQRLAYNMYGYVAKKNIQLITKAELLGLLQKVEARGAYNLSRRLLNDCRQIWQYAMVLDICKQDITIGLGAVLHSHTVVHQKAVSIIELPDLMKTIANYDKEDDRICCYALQLIALTFVRKSELTYAKWHEFDLDKAIWKIPAERMKMRIEHVVPLSKQAIGLLRFIKHTYPSDNYVINKGNADVPVNDDALIYALYWMGYKHRMTVHGFRAIASTALNEQEFRPDVIERQLAHAEPNTVRRAYNRAQYMNERISMMNWWGDYLENITPFNSLKSC
ncbi:MAG: site-specific integrase [Methylotenera sp.]